LRESLSKLQADLDTDDVIRALREDPSSSHFAHQRMREICDNHIIADGEREIQQLRAENIVLREGMLKVQQSKVNQQAQVKSEEVESQVKNIR
jgi:hypothetical protein